MHLSLVCLLNHCVSLLWAKRHSTFSAISHLIYRKDYVSPVLFIMKKPDTKYQIIMKTHKNISALLVVAVACTLLSSCTIDLTKPQPESPAPRYGLYVPPVSTYTPNEKPMEKPKSVPNSTPNTNTGYGSCTQCSCTHFVKQKCYCLHPPCVCGHSSSAHR